MSRTFALLALQVLSVAPAQDPTPTAEPASPAFDWYDTIDHPKLAGLPFVALEANTVRLFEGDEPTTCYTYGYVVEQTETTLRLVTTDLVVATISLADGLAGQPFPPPVRLQAEKLAAAVMTEHDEMLEAMGAYMPPPYLSPMARSFVLAHTCRANGDTALARRLLAFADAKKPAQASSLQAALASELGDVAWWRIVLAFNDPEVPLEQLATRTERLLRDFPKLRHAESARRTHARLRTMLAEARPHSPVPDPGSQTPEQRIAELVFRLREQNGYQWGQPGSCDIFADPRGDESPAHRLLAEGLAAAPALAAAMDDRSFTRSVGYHRDFYFSHRVLRVADVAQRVLHRMTGQWFEDRAAAEGFAETLQEGGETAAVLQSVVDRGSAGAAARLLELSPQTLLAAGTQVFDGPRTDSQKAKVLRVVGGVDDKAAVQLLTRASKDGGPRTRLAAGIALAVRDEPLRTRGLAALGKLWTDLSDELKDQPRLVSIGWKFDLQERVGRMLGVLGGETAMKALASRPQAIRHDALLGIGGEETWLHAYRPGTVFDDYAPASVCDRSPAGERARERLLGSLLQDRTVLIQGYNNARNPRRCDFAAHALAHRWPTHYAFDLEAAPDERDRLLVQVRATWQKRMP